MLWNILCIVNSNLMLLIPPYPNWFPCKSLPVLVFLQESHRVKSSCSHTNSAVKWWRESEGRKDSLWLEESPGLHWMCGWKLHIGWNPQRWLMNLFSHGIAPHFEQVFKDCRAKNNGSSGITGGCKAQRFAWSLTVPWINGPILWAQGQYVAYTKTGGILSLVIHYSCIPEPWWMKKSIN